MFDVNREPDTDRDILFRMIEVAKTKLKKKDPRLYYGAVGFKHYYIIDKSNQKVAAHDAYNELIEEGILKKPKYHNMMYRPKRNGQSPGYATKFIGTPSGLGECMEEAVRQRYFPEYRHKGGQSEYELVHKSEPPKEIKTRSVVRDPNTDSKQLELDKGIVAETLRGKLPIRCVCSMIWARCW